MDNLHQLKPKEFLQPTTHSYSRKMEGAEEIIQYLPNSHVMIWYNTDPTSYDNHFHKCIEIIYLLEGDCHADFQTQKLDLNTGDILIIPPYMMHSVKALHPFRQFVMQLDVTPMNCFGIYSSSSSNVNDVLLCNEETCPHIYTDILNNIIDIINSYFGYEPYWELETYSHFLQMIATIGKAENVTKSVKMSDDPRGNKLHYDKFAELLQYINANYSEQLTLENVSSRVGFSKYHFIRLFKEYTDMTFYDYLTAKRIEHAKEELAAGNKGITEIAFSCGFNSQTAFCRTFKKICGCPPTEYRQKIMMK